jgi:hypothetical protein
MILPAARTNSARRSGLEAIIPNRVPTALRKPARPVTTPKPVQPNKLQGTVRGCHRNGRSSVTSGSPEPGEERGFDAQARGATILYQGIQGMHVTVRHLLAVDL